MPRFSSAIVLAAAVALNASAGEAAKKPDAVRTRPKDGILLAPGLAIDAAQQLASKGDVQATWEAGGLRIVMPAAKDEQHVTFKPAIGRWDLRDCTEIRVKVKNVGQAPLTPSVQALSNGGATDAFAATAPLAPGATQEIVLTFAPIAAWKGAAKGKGGFWGGWDRQPGTGTTFSNDAASGLKFSASHDAAAVLLVESVVAQAPAARLPEWLGKRPPLEGDWILTFSDDFDGTSVDEKKWNYHGPNYWDKATHWSKDNVTVAGGLARLRYEKKTGRHNDDPKEKETAYAGGFLETYGKWVQRYGYFEARMKLPRAPGLAPAFWMMPDRGVKAGPQWVRQDTGKSGMEFDIVEHLTRWGPQRYNIAMHWDGYQKEHQAIGSQCIYVNLDSDGFITGGLLWLPGQAVYYCNGLEVARWESARISSIESDLMFTMPQGGWDNNALDDAQLPAELVIDYVRVWQRKDLASAVDGFKATEPKPASQPEAK